MSDIDGKINRFLADLDRVWSGGYAAVLFGSAARGDGDAEGLARILADHAQQTA